MNKAEIVLTEEELLVFLAHLGLSTILGLEEDPLAWLEEAEVAARLNSGEHSLVQRGLLSLDGAQQATIDDALVALVGGAAVPDATLVVTHLLPSGGAETRYFHATPELLIEQSSPRTGIYRFAFIPDGETLTYRLQALLAPLHVATGSSNGLQDYQVPSATLAQIFAQRQNRQSDGATQLLRERGLPPETAALAARDLLNGPAWLGVAAWGLRSVQPLGAETVMALLGQEHCWLIADASDAPDQARFIPAAGFDCEAALMSLLKPLLATVTGAI